MTQPGGRIVMGNWIPGDPTLVAQILKISAAYSPPPPEGFVSPMTWGVEDEVRRALRRPPGSPPEKIAFERATWFFRYAGTPAELLGALPRLLRPDDERLRRGRGRAGRRDQLEAELTALFEAQNVGRTATTEIPATFLKVTATKN